MLTVISVTLATIHGYANSDIVYVISEMDTGMLPVTSSMTLGTGHGYVNSDIKYVIRKWTRV